MEDDLAQGKGERSWCPVAHCEVPVSGVDESDEGSVASGHCCPAVLAAVVTVLRISDSVAGCMTRITHSPDESTGDG